MALGVDGTERESNTGFERATCMLFDVSFSTRGSLFITLQHDQLLTVIFPYALHAVTFGLHRKLAEELASTPGANPKEFITLQHGSLLQVKGSQIVSSPKLLPVS